MTDVVGEWSRIVREHGERRGPLAIVGGSSKTWLGNPPEPGATPLHTTEHAGVIDYQPGELMLRVRAGTRISTIVELLAKEGQMLGFEPADFDGNATLGGTVSTGLSGPQRPWYGGVRDAVLGIGLVTGRGDYLEFGGQVMKNVAGFDVSRLVTGAFGTLGIIADASLKVLPAPASVLTLVQELPLPAAHKRMLAIGNSSLPVSGLCYLAGCLYVRLAGSTSGVAAAAKTIGGDNCLEPPWDGLRNLNHPALKGEALWRVSVPAADETLLEQSAVINWGGAERYLANPDFDPRQQLNTGHATRYRGDRPHIPFQPLAPVVFEIHRALKQKLDPFGILNPDRMYKGL